MHCFQAKFCTENYNVFRYQTYLIQTIFKNFNLRITSVYLVVTSCSAMGWEAKDVDIGVARV